MKTVHSLSNSSPSSTDHYQGSDLIGSDVDITHQAIAHDQLVVSAAHQRLLSDFEQLSADCYWQTDSSFRYEYMSDRFTEVTGISKNLIIGFSDVEIGLIEDDPTAWRDHWRTLQKHDSFRDFRFSMLHPDGRTIVLSTNGEAFFDDAGVFAGYRGLYRMICDSNTRIDENVSSRSIYQTAERIAGLGFWEWDESEDRCTYCSAELAEIHGVTVDEYLQISKTNAEDRRWMHPDDRERYGVAAEAFRNEHRGFEIEYRLIRADGDIVTVCEFVAPIVNENRDLIRSFGFVKNITQNKQAATRLKKITSLYQQTASMAKIGHWEWDELSDKSTYCSEELARLHGLTIEDYHRRTTTVLGELQLVHPDDRNDYKAAVETYLQHPRESIFEYRLATPDTSVRNVREIVVPKFDNHGKHVRSVGSVQDITESKLTAAHLAAARNELEHRVRKRTKELQAAITDLKASETRTQNANKIAKLGYFQWDLTHDRGVSCDEQVAEILGIPVETYRTESKDNYIARIHRDDQNRVLSTYDACGASKTPVDIEYRILQRDGSERYIHELSTSKTAGDGKTILTFGTLQDITDYRKISNELTVVEERLHELGANAREVFCVVSADWQQIIYVSEAYEEIWGRNPQDIMENPNIWLEYLHPDDRKVMISEICRKIDSRDKSPEFSECRIIRPDGETRWLSCRVYAVLDSTGKILRFAGVAEDVTERKAELEVLHQAQKMDAVGQLTEGVAHDFNNLLAVILGNTELLQGRVRQADENLLQDIIAAGDRGAELTRRLLAFSRLQPLRPVTTDVVDLVRNMGELLCRTLGTTISVDISADCRAKHVLVDASLLENAILNLALNARDAMPNGGRLRIDVSNEDRRPRATSQNGGSSGTELIWISVHDSGIGMDAYILSRAIEPFFTTKHPGHGSGLGLPMVYGFVKQSEGDLFVDSTKNKGTVVRICLPLQQKEYTN